MRTDDRTVIARNRSRSAAAAAFFGALALSGTGLSIADGRIGGIALSVALLGGPSLFFTVWATQRRPVLVIDDVGLTIGRACRQIPWSGVADVRVGIQQGLFGESHHLVLRLVHGAEPTTRSMVTTNATATDEIDISLDWLSLRWDDVVRAVERHSRRTAARTREHAFGRS